MGMERDFGHHFPHCLSLCQDVCVYICVSILSPFLMGHPHRFSVNDRILSLTENPHTCPNVTVHHFFGPCG